MPQDKRFADPRWRSPPFVGLAQAFLLQHWWQHATTDVPGVTRHHEQMVAFAARQWLDMLAPSNKQPAPQNSQKPSVSKNARWRSTVLPVSKDITWFMNCCAESQSCWRCAKRPAR